MAKIYTTPEGFPAAPDIDAHFPDGRFDPDSYAAAEQTWLDELGALAKAHNPHCRIAGETIRFPVADGYATYMVWDDNSLIHCPLGDAWSIPAAHARGLRAADLHNHVERERKLRALFTKTR